jgi:predicted branched-subunit amino acid permease
VITAMLAAGSSLWVAALTVMAMDVRHVLYGPSLRSRIHRALIKKTALWAFGLTDEVLPPPPLNWYATIAAGAKTG